METENKNYAVTEFGNEHVIKLSPKMYKTAMISLGLGAVLFVGSCGYSIYSYLNSQNNQAAVEEMQKSSEMQQEQLLNLSKKAAALSEELQNLTLMETELRIQAGVKPPKDVEEKATEGENQNKNLAEESSSNETDSINEAERSASSEENSYNGQGGPINNYEQIRNLKISGQGGPISELQFSDVEEALTILETDMKTRRESLEELQVLLKSQRELISMVISGQPVSDNISKMIANVMEIRQKSDYEDFYFVSKETAMVQIKNAEYIVGMAKTYIKSKLGE